MMIAKQGFTLVELAVALLIVGLLLAGALIPLTSQVELSNIANTQRTMDEIKQALLGFAQVNGRLPCPARGQTPAGTTDTVTWGLPGFAAGSEQFNSTTSSCNTVLGVLPWVTLGVSETDSWGRRFTYRVSPAFADFPIVSVPASYTIESRGAPAGAALGTTPQTYRTTPASPADQTPTCPPPSTLPTTASFVLCSLGDVVVLTRDDTSHLCSPQVQYVPVVVISHGRNGYGAYKPDGQRVTGTGDLNSDGVPDLNADEAANATGTSTASAATCPGTGIAYTQNAYYSRTATSYSATCSDTTSGSPMCEFDDIVIWIAQPLLASRMVSAGKLP